MVAVTFERPDPVKSVGAAVMEDRIRTCSVDNQTKLSLWMSETSLSALGLRW